MGCVVPFWKALDELSKPVRVDIDSGWHSIGNPRKLPWMAEVCQNDVLASVLVF